MGLIPIGPDQTIADSLGIPHGVAACDSLSRRVIRRLDVGKANHQYFLLQLQAPAGTTVTCDDTYSVESLDPEGGMAITNLVSGSHSQPDDGQLELVVQPAARGGWGGFKRGFDHSSVFPIHHAKLQCHRDHDTLLLDGQTIVKTPTLVEVGEKKLEVIVGRNNRL
jgi:diacylglycerol kinase family enzyme